MMENKLVVAVKANGKVLRETKDLVHLPFRSQFSVLVKNLNSRRAKFTLHIDGADVLDGTEIIVNANDEIELKRFIRNGNMNEGNSFKFIERTTAIEDGPRGIKVDDGLIRVEFWFEHEEPIVKNTIHNDWYTTYEPGYSKPHYPWNQRWNYPYGTLINSGIHGVSQDSVLGSASINNVSTAQGTVIPASTKSTLSSKTADVETPSTNDVGITVPGSKVEQKFSAVYGFKPEAVSHVIVLRIAGMVGDVAVVTPVTVKSKNICPTCSHNNKSNAKFCNQCGTALELF